MRSSPSHGGRVFWVGSFVAGAAPLLFACVPSPVSEATDRDAGSDADVAINQDAQRPVGQAVAFGQSGDVPLRGDFDGDGRQDLAVWRPSGPSWRILYSSSGVVKPYESDPGDIPAPADYDGDGITDIAVYKPASITWHFVSMSTGAQKRDYAFGEHEDFPLGFDFDGDGRADYSIFRKYDGVVSWNNGGADGGSIVDVTVAPAYDTTGGLYREIPLRADFDGDGKADPAVWVSKGAIWAYQESATTGAIRNVQFGLPDDYPITGDFDGDGKTDIAVFRPSTGEWIFRASGPKPLDSFVFGQSGDVPMVGRYDKDAIDDIVVWRPSDGRWYSRTVGLVGPSSNGL